MTVIVKDDGFHADDWTAGFENPENVDAGQGIDLGPDADLDHLMLQLSGAPMIRIRFPSFADGRGFTLARLLRTRGYTGRLRAVGHVISDQYAMARRAGFDEVEISDDLAKRQPQDQWLFRANWQANDYQSRLRGSKTPAGRTRCSLASSAGGSTPCSSATAASCNMRRAMTMARSVGRSISAA